MRKSTNINNLINLLRIIETTDEEKTEMYMKCTKSELTRMLIECNKIIDKIAPTVVLTTAEVDEELRLILDNLTIEEYLELNGDERSEINKDDIKEAIKQIREFFGR
jgi:hypothetical protein